MEAEPTKADPPKRKRHWFQFSLRTLMIGIAILAILCAYVSWQGKIAKRRMVMYQQFFSDSKEITRIGMICDFWSPILNGEAVSRIQTGTVPRVVVASSGLAADRNRPSAFRKWLGEPDIVMRVICFSQDAGQADVDEVAYLFPTAILYRIGGPQNAVTAIRLPAR
jgi:hypothetical protein